ncbi:MAG TPA: GNAT family N-acetyltransferase, partial [Acidimicrobiia bacterium]
AARHRTDVRIYRTAQRNGVVVLGRGLTRRWELAFEVDEDVRDRGVGTRTLAAARTLLPAGTPLWMQIAPGNARSLRAAISAGFRPIGAEIVFT